MPEIRIKRNNKVKKSQQHVRTTSGKKDEGDGEEGPRGSAQDAKQCEERRDASER